MKYRQQFIIYYLASSKEPLTSSQLAKKMSVSVRTIKNDMQMVKEILVEHGASLVSKKSEGYSLELHDIPLFHALYEQLTLRKSIYNTLISDRLVRSIYIARRLAGAQKEVKLEEVADELYLSRSAIKEAVRLVYPFFESFNLVLESRPNYGIGLIGQEQYRRLAITELVAIHYHKATLDDAEEGFCRWVECKEEERQSVRRIFLKVLRESGLAIRDTLTQKLAVYLVITKNRIAAGYEIKLNEDWLSEAESSQEYEVAKAIFVTLDKAFGGYPEMKHEYLFMASLLQCYRDYSTDEVIENKKMKKEAEQLAEQGFGHLIRTWQLDLQDQIQLKEDLVMTMVPLLYKIIYGISATQVLSRLPLETVSITDTPLSLELARSFIHFIEKEKHCQVSVDDLVMCAFKFYGLISRFSYPYRKAKLLVVSTGGKRAARTIIERIEKRYDSLLESVQACELYEIRGMDQSLYDGVVMDTPEFAYNYELPFLILNTVSRRHQFDQLHNQILINNYGFNDLLMPVEACRLYDHFEYSSSENFLRFISYKHGMDDSSCKLLEQWLMTNESFFSYENSTNSVIIMGNYALTQKECIEIYRLKKPALWNREEIRHILFYSLDFSGNLYKLKAMENLTREFTVTPSYFDELFETSDPKLFEEMIKNCLKSE